MREKRLNKVSFDLVRYANCWEDADVLLKGLEAGPGSRILSICSAGDNSFSLLVTGAELVVAVDVNRLQLYLTELKKAAFKSLDHNELLEFLGFLPCHNRHALFSRAKVYLNKEACRYWESNIRQIEEGVIYKGKFERYFSFFQRKILPLIHNRKRVEKLFEEKSSAEQKQFYSEEWNTWRWKLLFKIFFNKYVMGKYGRDPEFLRQVKVPVSQFIFDKAEKHLSSVNAQKNYYLRFIHTGCFGSDLPHYARSENFEMIKRNIDKLVLYEGFAEDALTQHSGITHMNLSNIFEYMDMETFKATAGKLVSSLAPGGRLAYWNLMVPRRVSEHIAAMQYRQELSENLSEADKGFFYNRFIIDEKV
jgi:S-adenosylmethionine-diacylglycerol 3-amino-3-carboxypropyl transferase